MNAEDLINGLRHAADDHQERDSSSLPCYAPGQEQFENDVAVRVEARHLPQDVQDRLRFMQRRGFLTKLAALIAAPKALEAAATATPSPITQHSKPYTMNIHSAGNVGLGTLHPDYKLHIPIYFLRADGT